MTETTLTRPAAPTGLGALRAAISDRLDARHTGCISSETVQELIDQDRRNSDTALKAVETTWRAATQREQARVRQLTAERNRLREELATLRGRSILPNCTCSHLLERHSPGSCGGFHRNDTNRWPCHCSQYVPYTLNLAGETR